MTWLFRKKSTLWIEAGLAALVLMAGGCVSCTVGNKNSEPSKLDDSTTRTTEKGYYSISYTTNPAPIPINELHSWIVTVRAAKGGQPVDGADMAIDGDMPEHGHGMPTKPQLTERMGQGRYRIGGMKFQMAGRWVVDITVNANGQSDHVSFNLMLQ